jgi:hypothetical protein
MYVCTYGWTQMCTCRSITCVCICVYLYICVLCVYERILHGAAGVNSNIDCCILLTCLDTVRGDFHLSAVVTQPPAHAGRRKVLTASAVQTLAGMALNLIHSS